MSVLPRRCGDPRGSASQARTLSALSSTLLKPIALPALFCFVPCSWAPRHRQVRQLGRLRDAARGPGAARGLPVARVDIVHPGHRGLLAVRLQGGRGAPSKARRRGGEDRRRHRVRRGCAFAFVVGVVVIVVGNPRGISSGPSLLEVDRGGRLTRH